MTENEISYIVRKAIFNVYNGLGPGLLESVYHKILIYELEDLGLDAKSEVTMPIKVITEIKSVKDLENVHYKQLSTYLKLSDEKLGLLVNFNTDDILNSIKRVVNKIED